MTVLGEKVDRAGTIADRAHLSHPQEMVITNLQPETAYSITVAAYTMKGDGARSKPKVVVTKGAGRIPIHCTASGSIRPRAIPMILKPEWF